jgi:hypothetical protein
MSTYYTGSSNYPNNFDVIPTGTGVTTTPYVLDETRNINGLIIQSGNQIVAVQLNGVYTIIQAIEETLGTNPNGAFTTVGDRFVSLETSGGFVRTSGDDMTGDLNMISGASIYTNFLSGSSVLWTVDSGLSIVSSGTFGIQNIGIVNISALSNYTINLSGNTVASLGNNISSTAANLITLVGPNGIRTSGNLYPIVSHTNSLGTTGNTYSGLYVDYANVGTGSFHAISGMSPIDVLSSLNLATGVSITSMQSGVAIIGGSGNPFSGIYVNNILNNDNMIINSALGAMNISSSGVLNIGSNSGNSIFSASSGNSSLLQGGQVNIVANSGTGVVGVFGTLTPTDSSSVPTSGILSIGTTGAYFNTIYVDTIISPTLAASGVVLTTFVSRTGSSMTGSLTMTGTTNLLLQAGSVILNSGASVTNTVSGINSLGSAAFPFSGIYTTNINENPISRFTFNEVLTASGTVGVTQTYKFANTPIVGAAMIFVSGLLMSAVPSKYTITGSGIVFTFVPGINPYSTYTHL